MAYLSLNFVVPDDMDCPDAIDVVSVEGDKFFLLLNYIEKGFEAVFPSTMHIVYENNVGILRHKMFELCRDLLHENERVRYEEKTIESPEKSEKLQRGSRHKKA